MSTFVTPDCLAKLRFGINLNVYMFIEGKIYSFSI